MFLLPLILAAVPQDAAALFSLGTQLAQQGKYQQAIATLRQIPAEDADDAVYFNLGLASSHLRLYNEARGYYFRAIDKHPGHALAYFRVGLDYAAEGQGRKALPWFFRASQFAPGRPKSPTRSPNNSFSSAISILRSRSSPSTIIPCLQSPTPISSKPKAIPMPHSLPTSSFSLSSPAFRPLSSDSPEPKRRKATQLTPALTCCLYSRNIPTIPPPTPN